MASNEKGLRVGDPVYWIHRKSESIGYGGKVLLYSRVHIVSLTEHCVQIGDRQYVPYESVHKPETIHTLNIPDQKGVNRTIISDSVRIRAFGGGSYGVEGVDFNQGNPIILVQATGKGAITACKTFIHEYNPELREIERHRKEEQRQREEAASHDEEIKKEQEEKQKATDSIEREQILNSYLESESNCPISRLRKAFFSLLPKDILAEAEKCMASGIEESIIMNEGIMKGYLRALEWLYELHLKEWIFFPEIMVYNKQVYQHIAGFKNLFAPAPIRLSKENPILIFTNPSCTPASFWYDGIFKILDIPTIVVSNENNLQKVEDLISETEAKTVLCFILEGKNPQARWSNDLAIPLVEKLQEHTETKLLVIIENSKCSLERLRRIPSKNITYCRSPIDVVDALSREANPTQGQDDVELD
ncbi:MAG: hypothetical protein VB025_08300 [Sphaerochaeta sp.]|nr:hypothetical protein [Sphaerochaeta sp.]